MIRMSRFVTLALLVSTTSAFPSFVTQKKITSLNMSTGESPKVIEVVSQPDQDFLEKKGCDSEQNNQKRRPLNEYLP